MGDILNTFKSQTQDNNKNIVKEITCERLGFMEITLDNFYVLRY